MIKNKKAGKDDKPNKPAIKQKPKQQLYQENTIGTKKKAQKIHEKTGADINGKELYSTKTISRIIYLKLCWNCGAAYESKKINSYACSKSCSANINYKLKNGYNPAVRMDLLTKVKNVNSVKDRYEGY